MKGRGGREEGGGGGREEGGGEREGLPISHTHLGIKL